MTTVGQPLDRVDGPVKVAGQAKYGADYQSTGLVYGYVVTSTVANATIREMDVRAAERSGGVVAVYTPFRTLALKPVSTPFGDVKPPMQDKEVRHYGQVIGLVIANTFEQARDAAMLVRVTYAERPPVLSITEAIAHAKPFPVDGEPATVTILADGVKSIEEALRDSEVIVAADYLTAPQAHAAMEPYSAVVEWNNDSMVVHTGTQSVSGVQAVIAGSLGLDPAKVRVVTPFVGGSFGGKLLPRAEAQLAAAAAQALRRSVKLVLTREQSITATAVRPGTKQTIRLGASRSGVLTVIDHDAVSGSAAGQFYAEPSAHRSSRYWYQSRNLQVSQRTVELHLPDGAVMRAPGEATGGFALETAMDELAVRLDIDPIELRIKNHTDVFPGTGKSWSSKHLLECYRLGAARFGWRSRPRSPQSKVDGDWFVGMGMATAVYPGFRFPMSVKICLKRDETVAVGGDTLDLGTGMWTVLTMVTAESLGVAPARIRPSLGDTTLSPTGGVGGSAGTASIGPAIMAAAHEATKALIQLAKTDARSPFRGNEDVRYDRGRVVSGRLAMPFGELLRVLGRAELEATGFAAPGEEAAKYAFHSFGAQFCEVRVNKWTGEPRVSRVMGVFDAGRIVNPKTARNQLAGGMIWGVSAALHEGLHADVAGRLPNANLADYLLPVNADIPPVEVHFVQHPDTLFNPLGARGVGELGTVGMAAAVGNAIYNATGKRLRVLPFSLDQLIDA